MSESFASNGITTTTNDYYAVTAGGLNLYRQDITNPHENISVVMNSPINLLPASFSDGNLYNYSGTGAGSGTINGVNETWTENINVTIVIVNSGTLTLPAGKFQAVRITDDSSFTDQGTGFTRSGSSNVNLYYIASIGLAESTGTTSETINGTTTTDTPAYKLTATNLFPTIALTGNSNAIPNGEAAPSASNFTNFGNWGAGTTLGTLTRTYVITNTGGSPLGLTGSPLVKLTGIDATDFLILNQPSTNLIEPGATDDVTVVFDPISTHLGVRTAELTIASTDPALASFTFEIQGESLTMTTLTGITSTDSTTTGSLQYAITTRRAPAPR